MLTVVLATFNGATTLPLTLESFTKLELPEDGWKLIVVDNASTDTTPQILEDFSSRLPLERLYQPKRGKNAALNMAIPHFEGELIVFTDDDIVVPPEWLRSFKQIACAQPQYSVFGGRVMPQWPDVPPEAIIRAIPLGPAYAIHPPDLADGEVTPGMIFGPNMAIRALIFADGIRFNEKIGPSSGNYIMGSETEFTWRLERMGHRCWFSTEIVVKHQIRAHQLSPRWLRGRAKRFGRRSVGVEALSALRKAPHIFGVPRRLMKVALKSGAGWTWGFLTGNAVMRLRGLWNYNYAIASMREYRRRRLED